MPTCSFFGHRDCPDDLRPLLKNVILDLIATHGVDMFYVGHQGGFDGLVRSVLCEIAQEYPRVHYAVVLAYMPSEHPPSVTHLTLCCRRALNWFIHAMPSPGATIGCSNNLTL